MSEAKFSERSRLARIRFYAIEESAREDREQVRERAAEAAVEDEPYRIASPAEPIERQW